MSRPFVLHAIGDGKALIVDVPDHYVGSLHSDFAAEDVAVLGCGFDGLSGVREDSLLRVGGFFGHKELRS